MSRAWARFVTTTLACSHILISCLLFCLPCKAQDANYWTNQFGARSALMGGAVVGGVRDNSAVVYNPGALAWVTNPSLSVSANALNVDQLQMRDGAGTGLNLKSTEVQLMPLLISGVKLFKKHPRTVLGYAAMTRQQNGVDITAYNDSSYPVYTLLPGSGGKPNTAPQQYVAEMNYQSLVKEYWGGITLARQLLISPEHKLSMGITQFVAFRSANLNYSQAARAYTVGSTNRREESAQASEHLKYNNLRLLWKLGLAYEIKGLKLGAAFTTASVSLTGSATVDREIQAAGLTLSTPTPKPPLAKNFYNDIEAEGHQENLAANYRSTSSLAVGAEYTLKRWGTTLAASAEWFFARKAYNLVTANQGEFYRTVTLPLGAATYLTTRGGAKGLINYAVGVEQRLTKRFDLLASFRTNQSYAPDPAQLPQASVVQGAANSRYVQASQFTLNLNHITAGIGFRRERSMLTLGLQWSFGNRNQNQQLVNLTNPKDTNFLFAPLQETHTIFNSYGMIIGVTQLFR